jgi:ClpP class serine protease
MAKVGGITLPLPFQGEEKGVICAFLRRWRVTRIEDTRGGAMGSLDIFWIFFMLSALQPIMRQKMLEAARKRMIARLERQRNSRVILLVHRQETMSLLGFPMFRYIDVHDSEEVLRAIQMTDKDVPIDLILHTPGGLVLASLQIARAIREHSAKVTVFVPHYAMSGGTLIALAADEIVMCPHSVLGPVDPQLGQYPAASILKVVAKKPVSEVDDQTLILADQAEKAVAQVRESVRELLGDRYPAEKADELARLLSEGTWTHDFPITCRMARELGLPVSVVMPNEVLQLMQLFPQPVRRTPTVEYLPIPRRSGRSDNRDR